MSRTRDLRGHLLHTVTFLVTCVIITVVIITTKTIIIIIRNKFIQSCSGPLYYLSILLFIQSVSSVRLSVGVPVALRWPTGLAIPGPTPARGEIFSVVNGVQLHTAFHYHPPIFLI